MSSRRRFQTELFTAGLQGAELGALVEELEIENIELVLDIRHWPSRFWRSYPPLELARRLRRAEIHYVHREELGPGPQHMQAQEGRWQVDLRRFRHQVRAEPGLVAWAAGLALRHRSCLVSHARAPNDGDRRVLAEEIAHLAGLRVLRLRERPAGTGLLAEIDAASMMSRPRRGPRSSRGERTVG